MLRIGVSGFSFFGGFQNLRVLGLGFRVLRLSGMPEVCFGCSHAETKMTRPLIVPDMFIEVLTNLKP